MKPFSIVVAFDSHYGIGKNGKLPWHLPHDLKHFKSITTTVSNPAKQNAVIMGRKTWESLSPQFRPLPGRVNVVLSRQEGLNLPDQVLLAVSLDDALSQVSTPNIEHIFVIGGAQIYKEAIIHPSCHKICVTHVQGDFNCDASFPAIRQQFLAISASEKIEENGIIFHFSEYLLYQ